MSLDLSRVLLPILRETFPQQRMRLGPEAHILVTFFSPNPEVGSVAIQDDGDEVTVFVADRTHFHIGCYDEGKTDEQKVKDIAEQLLTFLTKLFADEIEFYGTGTSGGCRERQERPRGLFSMLFLGRKSYVWSGPLTRGGDA